MTDPVSDVEGRDAELRERVARALWDFAFEEEATPGSWESAYDEERAVTFRGADLVLAALGLEQVGLEAWRERDAAAQALIGALRYTLLANGHAAGGPDFSLYREWCDLDPARLSPPSTGADAGAASSP